VQSFPTLSAFFLSFFLCITLQIERVPVQNSSITTPSTAEVAFVAWSLVLDDCCSKLDWNLDRSRVQIGLDGQKACAGLLDRKDMNSKDLSNRSAWIPIVDTFILLVTGKIKGWPTQASSTSPTASPSLLPASQFC
jgi:hypothetical protein